jgi:hypothetical protein
MPTQDLFKKHHDAALRTYIVLLTSYDVETLKRAAVNTPNEELVPAAFSISKLDNGEWGLVYPEETYTSLRPQAKLALLDYVQQTKKLMLSGSPLIKALFLLFIWIPGVVLLEAFTLRYVWNWYLTSWLNLGVLGWKPAIMIVLILSTGIFRSMRIFKDDFSRPTSNMSFVLPVLQCLITLTVAWLLK